MKNNIFLNMLFAGTIAISSINAQAFFDLQRWLIKPNQAKDWVITHKTQLGLGAFLGLGGFAYYRYNYNNQMKKNLSELELLEKKRADLDREYTDTYADKKHGQDYYGHELYTFFGKWVEVDKKISKLKNLTKKTLLLEPMNADRNKKLQDKSYYETEARNFAKKTYGINTLPTNLQVIIESTPAFKGNWPWVHTIEFGTLLTEASLYNIANQ